MIYQFRLPSKKMVKMEELTFKDYLKSNSQHYLIVEYNHSHLVCEVNKTPKTLQLTEGEKVKLDMENMDRGIILSKTWDKYKDRDYI